MDAHRCHCSTCDQFYILLCTICHPQEQTIHMHLIITKSTPHTYVYNIKTNLGVEDGNKRGYIIGVAPTLSPDLEQLLQPVTICPPSSPAHLPVVNISFFTIRIISVAVRTFTLRLSKVIFYMGQLILTIDHISNRQTIIISITTSSFIRMIDYLKWGISIKVTSRVGTTSLRPTARAMERQAADTFQICVNILVSP